jgi:uncharacterized coiled-coil DUF342 family protein
MPVTPQTIRDALALPPGGDPARRLPKDILAEHGAAHAADRKLIDKVIERLDWWATLSPTTIADDPAARREALALYREAEAAWLAARAAAKREKVLARQVALGEQVRHLRRKVDELIAQLGA